MLVEPATSRRAPRSVIAARGLLGCVAVVYLPVAVIAALVVGSLTHLDWTAGRGTAWGLHGVYAVLGAVIGVIGSGLAVVTATQMQRGRGWTRVVGLGLAVVLSATGFLIPGVILAVCLLQPETGEWLA